MTRNAEGSLEFLLSQKSNKTFNFPLGKGKIYMTFFLVLLPGARSPVFFPLPLSHHHLPQDALTPWKVEWNLLGLTVPCWHLADPRFPSNFSQRNLSKLGVALPLYGDLWWQMWSLNFSIPPRTFLLGQGALAGSTAKA